MKRSLYYLTFLFMAILILSSEVLAQPDVLKVYATPLPLDSVISMDQSSGSPHSTIMLMSTDTTYIFDKTSVFDYDLTIEGQLGTDGRPPCIQPDVLTDASVPGRLFSFSKDGGVVNIKNVYLLGVSIDNTVNSGDGMALLFSGSNMKVYIDNVIFEQWGQFDISDGSQMGSFWVTNCKFLNNVNSGSVYTGEAFRVRNDLGVTAEDTLVLKYNTYLATNAYALCAPIFGYASYINFSHNTVVSMVKNPLFSTAITNGVFDHNIFYAAFAGGQANGEYPWWDGNGVLSAILDMYLTIPKSDAVLLGIDTTQADWSAQAEAARKVQANDNIYFMPSALNDFYTSWNANYTPDSLNYIHVCGWINTQTDSMFNASSNWNNSDNKVNFDPGYGQGITDMIGGTGVTVPAEDGVGLIGYLTAAIGSGGAAGTYYSYHQSVPDFSSGNWIPTWPLAAYTSNDLKYSANVTATDNMPYGDPYWFTGKVTGVQESNVKTPSKFTLSEAYPNPFNPSTSIKFSLPEAGNVTLAIYNIVGQKVKTLLSNELKNQGNYEMRIDMSDFASGIYFYTMSFNNNISTKKMVLLK